MNVGDADAWIAFEGGRRIDGHFARSQHKRNLASARDILDVEFGLFRLGRTNRVQPAGERPADGVPASRCGRLIAASGL
jgi:hypothetical protein